MTTRKKLLLSSLIIVGIAAYLLYTGRLFFNYPSPEKYPVKGIDISHHQGMIDWEKLRSERLSFVYIKATEGVDFLDKRFAENWRNAKAENYAVGAYHFFTFCSPGAEQAQNFMQHVPRDSNSLPPVVDLEFGGNCKTKKSKQEIRREIGQFLDIITAHYGRPPMIYATPEFFDEYMKDDLKAYPLWYRNVFWKPDLPADRPWAFWQYRNRDHVAGIEGYVDMNVFSGDSAAFMRFLGQP